ncbi:hypothetical protein VX159_06435 [Dechloromonas sp. ZY10]|uniref:hypothetical protein n=1 Tax=Dechloromonas aquae TaxID=2664436 RepID=UPI003526DD0B
MQKSNRSEIAAFPELFTGLDQFVAEQAGRWLKGGGVVFVLALALSAASCAA